MSTQNRSEFPLEEQTQRLRARIADLEDDIRNMRESESQYKQVFESVAICMFLVDVAPGGRFKFAGFNQAEEKVVGLTNQEVSGKFVEDVFDEDLANKLIAKYRQCLDAGIPISYDDDLSLPAGRRFFHSNLIPMRNASGLVHRIVGACIDTTDLKRSQDEALARQKLESLGVLAGGIAHDFNNLLGGILAQAELAEAELAEDSVPDQEIQAIKKVAIRAGEIVRELMVYSGQDEASLGPLDLSRLVEEMLELLKITISKHAVLRLELPKDLPAVRANAVQIQQVVMNLITNASEALEDRPGVISVTIEKVGPGENFQTDTQPEPSPHGYLRLEVRDTGSGMPPSILARIFDPFFTTKFAGRGLGLAAVQGIIRRHGGAIRAESVAGKGSRFEILLPCTSAPAANMKDAGVSGSAGEPGSIAGTVLLIEDEEILRRAVSKMLRKCRFSVIEAGDGTSGANLFRAHEPNIEVVLLDVTLPGMSGPEVAEELQRIRPDVKVILTSAFSEDKVRSSMREQQPWGYVRKPYQFSELVGLLRKACGDKPEFRA